ncbi:MULTISPECIES: PPE family protein [Mycobacterium avium complex (MAC)]|uniref:PPE family protein n=2 Tax=Mycobacterium avium complex (MAC) TaxID=120793 RepID=A0A7U5MP24_MYCIT|nr:MULTISPECIES: PPE family protein [Mycobacterium avium complex (MAC)]AFC55778.1 PPE family protein [Mycobacterium paraintracellulare]ASL17082.1 PPE family protein [Mycobacterium intracellulare subsp. chimaera]ASQ88053.1 PPE family protein [Mycobacterium intracellulare subsp. chimaera]ASW97100.1 PPE family protein [Mycobacterium intracellulare]MCA2231867.1 PPE family protein [Mycobacterium intracellulare]
MDFGILPPEIISALIHSGPGAWSLIEAAGFWQELSAELEQSASSYTAELSWLSTTWHGPSSMAMAQALEPYLAWLRLTAQQCQQTAASVQVVAAAFEWTHWTVVHPSLVAANRARLAMLLATNFFGVNYPAIAETEAEYHTMWVNNSAAMYRYAATSAGAVKLPQFSPPPEVANPSGATTQAAMVHAATTGNSGAQLLAADSIGQGSSAADAFDPNEGWFGYWSTWGNQFIAGGVPVNILGVWAQLATAHAFASLGEDIGPGLADGAAALASAETRLVSAIGAAGSSLAPRAALGVGISLGHLTMPPATVGMLGTSQAPVQLASAVSPLPPGGAEPPMLPMAPVRPGSGASGARRRKGRDYDDIEYGAELPGTVMHRPPSAG